MESDLIGINPWLIGEILFLIWFIIPLGFFPSEYYPNWDMQRITPFLYGLFWTWHFLGFSINTHWFDINFLSYTFPTVFLSFIYILVIITFYDARCSLRTTLSVGLASVLLPFLPLFATNNLFIEDGGYTGPLPILFILSLILLYRVPGPEIITETELDDLLIEI